jgi:hypothetical protein
MMMATTTRRRKPDAQQLQKYTSWKPYIVQERQFMQRGRRYHVRRLLGVGTSSKTYFAVLSGCRNAGKCVAVKVLKNAGTVCLLAGGSQISLAETFAHRATTSATYSDDCIILALSSVTAVSPTMVICTSFSISVRTAP